VKYSLKDLEQLTGIAWATFKQWKALGYIDTDGTGAGTRGDPLTFTEESVYRAFWLAQMRTFNVSVETALTLWEEHLLGQEKLLLIAEDGARWMSSTMYEEKMKSLFADHPAFFTVSMVHFYDAVKQRLTAFQRVKKMRNKIGLPTENVGEPMSLVH
jgi:hypothetical protein